MKKTAQRKLRNKTPKDINVSDPENEERRCIECGVCVGERFFVFNCGICKGIICNDCSSYSKECFMTSCKCVDLCSYCIKKIKKVDGEGNSDEFRSIEYLEKHPHAFEYLDDKLKSKESIIIKAVSGCMYVYHSLPKILKNNYKIKYTFLRSYQRYFMCKLSDTILLTVNKLTDENFSKMSDSSIPHSLSVKYAIDPTALMFVKYLADSSEKKPLFFTFGEKDVLFNFGHNKNKRKYEENSN